MDYSKELDFAKRLAREAGEVMRKYFLSEVADVTQKEDKTLVTKADTEINSLVIKESSSIFPEYSVHGEEEVFHVDNPKATWVCDPVDGTMPFAKGLPISTFSLALVNSDGAAVVGVVYDPYNDRLFEAVQGRGAFLNGNKIKVSSQSTLDLAYINEELWVNNKEGIDFDDPKDLMNKAGAKVTTLCSACITGALVATGHFDALLFGQTKPEDIAALAVIVTEAGGRVTDLFGNEQRYDRPIVGAIVSNGFIHEELVGIMAQANYQNPYK